jgi:hypothetical protein
MRAGDADVSSPIRRTPPSVVVEEVEAVGHEVVVDLFYVVVVAVMVVAFLWTKTCMCNKIESGIK